MYPAPHATLMPTVSSRVLLHGILGCLLVSLECGGSALTSRGPQQPRPGDALTTDTPVSPRSLIVEIVVEGTVEEVLSGDALRARNRELGIPEDTSPTLLFWASDLRNHLGQQNVRRLDCDPPPALEQAESENGNTILFWDFSNQMSPGSSFTLRRVYALTLSPFEPPVALPGDLEYDRAAYDYERYTRSEPFVELTPEIRRAAEEAVGGAKTPLERAHRIFGWVRRHMTYVYPPPGGRGSTVALREGKGDCGQYAVLFAALCRTFGIPARMAAGFSLGDSSDGTPPTVGSHAWAEFMLPDGRWVPADPTGDEEHHFARLLSNRHITASVGLNIPLPRVPAWAKYSFSDVEGGRTEFMQSLTELCTGAKVKTTITRNVIK